MIVFLLFSVIYIGFLLWVRRYWNSIPTIQNQEPPKYRFSVILPVRNEAENIERLIQAINGQSYPKTLFEVILVDDFSSDNTVKIAQQELEQTDLNYRIIQLKDENRKGKKHAITAGVQVAKNEIILTTDGDCEPGAGWIAVYNSMYFKYDLQMVTGPVKMQHHNFFTHWQAVEFSGLIGIGAASLTSGNPSMCNGANLSYRKVAFEEVKGYEGNFAVASGDDEFLLQKIYKNFQDKVKFLKHSDAIVYTPAKDTLGAFINQRIRWTSKWKFHKSIFIKLMTVMVFLGYCSLFYAFYEAHSANMLFLFLVVMALRWLVLFFSISPIADFFKLRQIAIFTIFVEILYPIIALFLGIASIFGYYSWKGRHYS